ncbi:hypothetical protein [Noviherbaspirillum sp.]|uniref:hypothetical protein n=1 Tax=Noviherbaspirillum sp. TaxID=1926288 RepID=UPI002FE332FE
MKLGEGSEERRASDVLYDQINSSKNSLRRSNIQSLKEVCDLMEKDRVQITLAEAVRRTGKDGPKYTTVSNKGSLLGEYVRLRMMEQAAGSSKLRSDTPQSVADCLQDPVLQARVRDTESVARYVKRENVALRGLLKNLRPGVEIDQLLASTPSQSRGITLQIDTQKKEADVSPALGSAVLRVLDHLIGERQYQLYRGRLTINSKSILTPYELEALRAATGLSEAEWEARFRPLTKTEAS